MEVERDDVPARRRRYDAALARPRSQRGRPIHGEADLVDSPGSSPASVLDAGCGTGPGRHRARSPRPSERRRCRPRRAMLATAIEQGPRAADGSTASTSPRRRHRRAVASNGASGSCSIRRHRVGRQRDDLPRTRHRSVPRWSPIIAAHLASADRLISGSSSSRGGSDSPTTTDTADAAGLDLERVGGPPGSASAFDRRRGLRGVGPPARCGLTDLIRGPVGSTIRSPNKETRRGQGHHLPQPQLKLVQERLGGRRGDGRGCTTWCSTSRSRPIEATLEKIVEGPRGSRSRTSCARTAKFKKLELNPDDYVDNPEAVVDILVKHKQLLQRPVIVKGTRRPSSVGPRIGSAPFIGMNPRRGWCPAAHQT